MTKLTVWEPFTDLWDLHDEIDRLFRSFGGRLRKRRERNEDLTSWAPSVDLYEDDEAIKMSVDLPGLTKRDVKIDVKDGVLTIRGERKFENEQKKDNYYRIEKSYGRFSRSFTLPNSVEADKIRAAMKDGVLEITIPKKEEAKPKEIEIRIE